MYWSGSGSDANNGLTSTSKNIYSLVFSEQPEGAHHDGKATGGLQLTGLGETLNITFASALSAAATVDVIGFKYCLLSVNAQGIFKKLDV